MREDDYTGSPIDDGDELSQIEDEIVGLYEFDLDEDPLSFGGEDSEMVIAIGNVADGAKTLRGAAELLYDLADELLSLSADGWEIVDDISHGYGTAVRFDCDEPEEESLTDD